MVVSIGSVDAVVRVHGHAVNDAELIRPRAPGADPFQPVPAGSDLDQARIPVPVGDEHIALRVPRDVGWTIERADTASGMESLHHVNRPFLPPCLALVSSPLLFQR